MRKIRKVKLFFWTVCLLAAMWSQTCQAWGAEQGENPVIEEPSMLYAKSAVLMDGDTGRVLYAKDGYNQMPMASTTKVMTCILALENGAGEEIVQVSANAAAQPDVQLNMNTGEQYYLKDLLYSLMLKSHNDTAVAIAEHIAGSVEAFAGMMNAKARELGCENTYFVTPNGLDGEDGGGVHSTTARDLAAIMSYAIRNEKFLAITQTPDYSFTDLEGRRIFNVHNTNALLGTMDGLLSGKTGFTGDAGYCYVCAVRKENRTFVIALLACGWPNNKTYKWQDTRKLVDYADANFHYQAINQRGSLGALIVREGIPVSEAMGETAYANIETEQIPEGQDRILLRDDETIEVREEIPRILQAPVRAGEQAGTIAYTLNGQILRQAPVIISTSIDKIDYKWCCRKILECFCL